MKDKNGVLRGALQESLRLVWDLKSGRLVVGVCGDLCGEVGRLALLNDLRMYELANAIIEEALKDKEKIKTLIKKLKIK